VSKEIRKKMRAKLQKASRFYAKMLAKREIVQEWGVKKRKGAIGIFKKAKAYSVMKSCGREA
jgi:intergrase/recombinase